MLLMLLAKLRMLLSSESLAPMAARLDDVTEVSELRRGLVVVVDADAVVRVDAVAAVAVDGDGEGGEGRVFRSMDLMGSGWSSRCCELCSLSLSLSGHSDDLVLYLSSEMVVAAVPPILGRRYWRSPMVGGC